MCERLNIHKTGVQDLLDTDGHASELLTRNRRKPEHHELCCTKESLT